MPIIDTHAHIDQIEDWPQAALRAKEAQVSDVIAMSVDLDSMQKVLDLARSTTVIKVHPALGVHPGLVKDGVAPEVYDFIRAHAKEAIAIGETGLDYWYKWVRDNKEERVKQQVSLTKQLQIAKDFDLPIVIHSRGAFRDCLQMTLDSGLKKVLFHWYSGPVDILEKILEAGFYVSTSPSVGYSPESQKAMLAADVNRILIETDAPVKFKDGDTSYISEPKDVVKTLKALALLKNIQEERLLDIVNRNARDLFRI
jgi:TatD DNase family protein